MMASDGDSLIVIYPSRAWKISDFLGDRGYLISKEVLFSKWFFTIFAVGAVVEEFPAPFCKYMSSVECFLASQFPFLKGKIIERLMRWVLLAASDSLRRICRLQTSSF